MTPIFLLVTILILLCDGWPILFGQRRVGKNKKEFTIYKFKTMEHKEGPLITSPDDRRVTKLGNFLRRSKIDELPQFFNIIKGDMSFVGYRPEPVCFVDKGDTSYDEIFKFKPGITGLSSIEYIDETKLLPKNKLDIQEYYLKHIAPKKKEIELGYNQSISFCLDIKLALKTMYLLGKGLFLEILHFF
jgi:lipopolysaccharide/colanic/teichoic acid biosynthesis glycosyltransferase